MKKSLAIIVGLICVLGGCSSVSVPPNYHYQEVATTDFTLATWQKVTKPQAVYKVYIEGDGHAFSPQGRPTADPTPQGTLVRELAFGDPSPNVVYLARPCQYVKDPNCTQKYWTTARFSHKVINAEFEAIKQIVGRSPVILIGFSGGAQVAGLLATTKPELNTKKIITIAGNLDHKAWTNHLKLPPLQHSQNLKDHQAQFATIPQIHYVGAKDQVIPPQLTKLFIDNPNQIIIIPNATHNQGWQSIYQSIWAQD